MGFRALDTIPDNDIYKGYDERKLKMEAIMNEDGMDVNTGISLCYPNQSKQTSLNTNSGAGVNADSRRHMNRVATDPPSELVWSPRRGLSLKCADCSWIGEKLSNPGDAEPSNMVLSSVSGIKSGGNNDIKPDNEKISTASEEELHVNSAAMDISFANHSKSSTGHVIGSIPVNESGTGGNVEELELVEEKSAVHFNQNEECNTEDKKQVFFCPKAIRIQDMARTSQECKKFTDSLLLLANESKHHLYDNKSEEEIISRRTRIDDIGSGSQMLGLESSVPKDRNFTHSDVLHDPMSNSSLERRSGKESAAFFEQSRTKVGRYGPKDALLEGLESSSENHYQHLVFKYASRQMEKGSRMDNSYPVVDSAPSSDNRINLLQGKGKEKVLFSKATCGSASKDTNDGHESVESCNSATSMSKGKRRCNLEQQLTDESKKIKRLFQEGPTSTSLVKQDSSFMNWISNMVKGLSKTNEDENPLALSLNHADKRHESYDHKDHSCNKTHISGTRSMGFQSIFGSLHHPKTNLSETRRTSVNYSVSGTKELVEAGQTCITVTPISFCRKNDDSREQILVESKNYNQHASGNVGDLSTQTSTQPRTLCVDVTSIQDTCKTNSSENINLSSVAHGRENGVSSIDTLLDKQKIASSEDNFLGSPSDAEGKAIPNVCNKNDPLRSLWITRFSSRNSFPVLDLDCCNHTNLVVDDSAGCSKSVPENNVNPPCHQKISETRETSAEDPVNDVGKDITRDHGTSTEASIAFRKILWQNQEKLICRQKSTSPTLKSSQSMASLFARRLEAIKSITSDVKDDGPHLGITCLFCGKSGHNLCNCSEVKKPELKDLLRGINSCNAADVSAYFCIKCFQLGHWAITCPMATSSTQHCTGNNASIYSYKTAGTVRLPKGSEPYSSIYFAKGNHVQVADENGNSEGKAPLAESHLVSPLSKGKQVLDGRIACLNEIRDYNSPSCEEVELREDQVELKRNFVSKNISGAANIFDAVRRLRLSRTDIIKWMNSNKPLSHLDGLFLRLRLVKWENGLRGTGYCVARINEAQREKTSKGSDSSVFVNVDISKCLVESRYVSNHDFSEDELMAWLHTTSRIGEIPTMDYLRSKFEEKEKLGFKVPNSHTS